MQPTRSSLRRATTSLLFGLAPGGVYHAVSVTRRRGGLLPHPFTLACATEAAIGGLLSVALSIALQRPGVTRHRALVEPGLSSNGAPKHPLATSLSLRQDNSSAMMKFSLAVARHN